MKLLKWVFLALTLFAFTLDSCKKSANNKPTVTNTVALKFNGTAYSTSTITAVYSKGAIQIIGSYPGGASIYLAVPSDVKIGTFDFAANTASTVFSTGTSAQYIGDSGTINIASFTSNTVAGTFSFHGTEFTGGNTCNVTDGTFQTTYTVTSQ